MRRRVYIAGPISKGDLRENLQRSREAHAILMRSGLAPLNPLLSVFAAGDEPSAAAGFSFEEWMAADLPWVAVAEAVLRLPGESAGADREVELARSRGVPVFHSAGELVKHFAHSV